MKKHLLLSTLLLSAGAAMAQDVATIVQPADTVPLYDVLHQNAPHFMNIPDVPRFALLGRDHKFYMGIGTNVKAVALYDAGHPVPNQNCFITYDIPMHIEPGNGGQFRVSAQQSNFYLNVVALPGTKNQLGAYVDMDFSGDGYSVSLSHAYMKYRHFMAGYTFSIFGDGSAAPSTIDYQGVNAYTGAKVAMVAYQPRFGKHKEWGIGVAIDMPNLSLTNATQTASVTQRVPNVPFYVQRSWADGEGWLRLSGLLRNLYYRDLKAGHNRDILGWGVKMSGKTPVYGGLTAMYEAVYGKGIASYIKDLNYKHMDLMPDPDNDGMLKPVELWAGYAGLQYTFNPRVMTTVAYSHVRTYADRYTDSLTPWGSGYRYAQYVVGNVFWNVNSIVRMGAEYLYGRRVNYDGSQAHDNRIQMLMQVSF